MAKKSMVVKQQRKQKYSRPVNTTDAKSAADRTLTFVSSVFAESASESLAYKGQIPGVKKASW